MGDEVAAVPRSDEPKTLGMKFGMTTGVGMFLLEQLFCTASAMWRRDQQCDRWRHPHQATVAEDMAPLQPSLRVLLGFTSEGILEVAKDIYCDQYQLALSISTGWCQDLLMQDLHDELD